MLKKLSNKPAPPRPESLYYLSADEPDKPGGKLGSIKSSQATVELSVVVPAYNEEGRLGKGLAEALDWLEESRAAASQSAHHLDSHAVRSYEVLIIDDGSSDQTVRIALQLSIQHAARTHHHPDSQIRVISLGKNRGKGGAVRHVSKASVLPPLNLHQSLIIVFQFNSIFFFFVRGYCMLEEN